MFPQQPQQQFSKAGADVQLFYRSSAWAKPPGVSHVYMMLIGGGGTGTGSAGGGSGAVTVWYGAAQHVPDNLVISVSTGSNIDTTVNYRGSSGLIALLTADASASNTAGTAMTANQFTASGFFNSTAGQNGSSATVGISTTTFLSGGGNVGASANYGYSNTGSGSGSFQMQPIIVGVGSAGANNGDIGGGGGISGAGGPGFVLIASW